MAIMSLDPTGKGQARRDSRWKTAPDAFDITFDGRLPQPVSDPNPPGYTVRSTDVTYVATGCPCRLLMMGRWVIATCWS
jgi:hypothetical protein